MKPRPAPLVSMEIDTGWHFLACLAEEWRESAVSHVSPLFTTDFIMQSAHIWGVAADTDTVWEKHQHGGLLVNTLKCSYVTPLSRIIGKSTNQTLSNGISWWWEVNTENSLFWSPARVWFGPKLYPRQPDQQRWRIRTLCGHQGRGEGSDNDTETDVDMQWYVMSSKESQRSDKLSAPAENPS